MKRHHILTILLLSVALGFFVVGILASTMMLNTSSVDNTESLDSQIVAYVNTTDFCTTFPELDLSSNDDYADEKVFLTDTYVNKCLSASITEEDSEVNDESLTEIANVISNKGSSTTSNSDTIDCGTMDVIPTVNGKAGNRDGIINITDFSFLAANFGKKCNPSDTAYTSTLHCGPMDTNQDYVIDNKDFRVFSEFFGMKCATYAEKLCSSMDANNDSNITSRDLVSSFAGGFPYKCKTGSTQTPVSSPVTNDLCKVTADANGDGYVTRSDYNFYSKNLNKGCVTPTSVKNTTTNRTGNSVNVQ